MIAPLATPNFTAKEGLFTIKSKTRIIAPPNAVLDILRDTTTWPKWNTFVPKVTVKYSPPEDGDDGAPSQGRRSASEECGQSETSAPLAPFSKHGRSSMPLLTVDTKFTEHTTLQDTDIVITVLEHLPGPLLGYRIAWRSTSYPKWSLHSERVHELVPVDGGICTECTDWETFGGPLAHAVKLFVGGKLVKGFGDWSAGLKRFAEERTKCW